MTLGERIAKCRKQKNLSQEYIAERLEVSRQAVSKWENDLSAPDTYNLIALAKLFDVSVEYLACGEENGKGGGTEQKSLAKTDAPTTTSAKSLDKKKPKSLITRFIWFVIFGVTFCAFLLFMWVTPINLVLIAIMLLEIYGIYGN